MAKYNVAIFGLGAIFSRHLSAIVNNPEHYKLVGIYDPIRELQDKYVSELQVKGYLNEQDAYADPEVNCIVILTPNHLHMQQATIAMENKKHVILEKPATFLADEVNQLNKTAKLNQVEVYCVLQVRLNPAVQIAKQVLSDGLLGDVRGASLVQRWQRPLNYFSGWRGGMGTGGGVLREFAIHYLDVMQYLIGMPKVSKAKFFQTKFITGNVSDSIYGLLDFDRFGGSFEISVAAEPKNLECTLSIMGSNGFLKLGGKSLDEIIVAEFTDSDSLNKLNLIKDKVLNQKVAQTVSQGASPYHPELYRQIIVNPKRFQLAETYNVIKLVEDAYSFL